MTRPLIFAAAVSVVMAGCNAASAPQTAAAPADNMAAPEGLDKLTVYTGGTIYTGLDEPRTVDAVLVDDAGRIVATEATLSRDWNESDVNIVDLAGDVMFPGFTDGHAHLLGIGQRELSLDLTGTASVADLQDRVATEAAQLPDDAIIVGRGWIETGWPEGRMPTAADLDAAVGDRIVILGRADGHALVASTAALEAAGITDATPDPEGGKIERDAAGKATGLLIDNAMEPVWALVSEPSEEDIRRAYIEGAKVYASRGWTGVHNMSVPPAHAPILKELDEQGLMPLRLWNAYDAAGADIARDHAFETDTIRNRAVKLYMDGALGSRGALLIEPYSDRPDTSGLSLTSPDKLETAMQRADAGDYQLAIHAIGDLANRRVIDTFADQGYGPDKRWRIEHTQIVAPADIQRIADLGLIASMQPSHAIGDLKFAPARLGMARLEGAYAWQDLLDAGAVVVGGSDAPVEVGSPLIEYYAAVAREDLEGQSGEGWHPEQALSRESALEIFTSAPAYAAFMTEELGTIEAGKAADFTVFDRDLLTLPEDQILDADATMTVVQGEIVWKSGD
ncbi:amidohydrolase [Henriciella sp.]|uniref:amidohydrolase n=1 Tax=Henriciella sp. TaxID=1968823 RepID=UPI0026390E52|nr:amidohydrolase [Henriciella sp.]